VYACLFCFTAAIGLGQTPIANPPVPIASSLEDPAYQPLTRAYAALRALDYEVAIAAFRQAAQAAPDRASIHKDLAYTLLKIGDNVAARDQFAEAARLDPADVQTALEYGFLCFETKHQPEARRVFDRLRQTGNATAAQAFENIDRPLRDGIARWLEAVRLSPDNFSAHEELAHLAEQRDDLPLASEHFSKAFALKPDRRDLLLDLGRIWKAQDQVEQANAALLAASRGSEPRVADQARELLPPRYPYVYEFQQALKLDPRNVELRREFAYLYLQMQRPEEAETQFRVLVQQAPQDLLVVAQLGLLLLNRGETTEAMPLLERVLKGNNAELAERVRSVLRVPQTLKTREEKAREEKAGEAKGLDGGSRPKLASDAQASIGSSASGEAKELGAKSLEKGYLQDAVKYLTIAHENDPLDYDVMLKLGWAYNILKDDATAVKWFNQARQSPDPKISTEASRAYRNLESSLATFRTTFWVSPTYSSRWHTAFAYAQVKTEMRLPGLPWLRPYSSIRFVGDTGHTVTAGAGLQPQSLSERSGIASIGMATVPWHGANLWFEAGESFRYSGVSGNGLSLTPDYRGGVAFGRGFGHLMGSPTPGFFAETNDDVVYVNRFSKDTLAYTQNRTGITFKTAQLFWNWNLTTDLKRQYWANFAETGPGLRFRFPGMPPSLMFSISAMRGFYLINEGNPRGPNFNDLRIGMWYAATR
jgi:Tfp pilus assembly protein PilF